MVESAHVYQNKKKEIDYTPFTKVRPKESRVIPPVISIPTHERQNCRPSCIDNILTNDPGNCVLSGCITDRIGDHAPTFEFTDIEFEVGPKSGKHVQYYDFSNANLNKFLTLLNTDLSKLHTTHEFSDFTKLFDHVLDTTCKLAKPKTTKRNPINNPWITDSISAAVEKKHQLKDTWIKSKTKANPDGDLDLEQTFKVYRRILKSVINAAKNTYSCNQIIGNKHDRKKLEDMADYKRT